MASEYCGNCPGRIETISTSACKIYGKLPWGEEPDERVPGLSLVDMLRPAECTTKPQNTAQVLKRRAQAQAGKGE